MWLYDARIVERGAARGVASPLAQSRSGPTPAARRFDGVGTLAEVFEPD